MNAPTQIPTPTQPSALEQSIRAICAAHNLHSFSVGLLIPNDDYDNGWGVDLQRWDGRRPVGSWGAMGPSIADALAAAIKRVEPVAVLADEALPELVS